MIEALRDSAIVERIGGKFKLTALIQRRWLQLLQGARPMVESKGLTEIETIMKEIVEGKIELEFPGEDEESNVDQE